MMPIRSDPACATCHRLFVALRHRFAMGWIDGVFLSLCSLLSWYGSARGHRPSGR